jgi:YfiH family protein
MSVRWSFSDRLGGVSSAPYDSLNVARHVGDVPEAVASNRDLLLARLSASAPARLVFMDQVHGDRVAVIDAAHLATDPADAPAATDGMVTALPGAALVVLVADCVPVLLADPVAGVVAAVHAGRPGLRARIVVKAVEAMAGLGAEPGRTQAWLGPSVCPACYEVPDGMRADVAEVVPASWSTSRTGTPALDLRAGLTAELEALGVTVESVGPCTAESPDHFSYRRDGRTGRFAGVVWLEP